MAKRAKLSVVKGDPPKGAVSPVPAFDASRFNSFVDDVNKARVRQQEESGKVGALMKSAVDALGVERPAFNLVVGLTRKDPAKAGTILRDILRMAHARGLFDQLSIFDDTTAVLREILDRIDGNGDGDGESARADEREVETV